VQYHPVPADDAIFTLIAGDAALTVHPAAGCRIGQITVAGQPLLVDEPGTDGGHPMAWGAYPMAPWAGRIRNGRFGFDGAECRLAINHHDGDGSERAHAIHGLVFDRPWPGVHVGSGPSCTGAIELDWEFGGMVTQTIELFADRVVVTLSVDSSVGRLPAEVGWHPWFRKPNRLDFAPTAMYRRDEYGIPTGELVSPSDGPWDDCFANTEPVVLHYERAIAPAVAVTSDCDHWVVYDMPSDATCVEPQSGPPDAFNLQPHVVDPATPLRRSMTISW
jgi:aldose 1-epimerase